MQQAAAFERAGDTRIPAKRFVLCRGTRSPGVWVGSRVLPGPLATSLSPLRDEPIPLDPRPGDRVPKCPQEAFLVLWGHEERPDPAVHLVVDPQPIQRDRPGHSGDFWSGGPRGCRPGGRGSGTAPSGPAARRRRLRSACPARSRRSSRPGRSRPPRSAARRRARPGGRPGRAPRCRSRSRPRWRAGGRATHRLGRDRSWTWPRCPLPMLRGEVVRLPPTRRRSEWPTCRYATRTVPGSPPFSANKSESVVPLAQFIRDRPALRRARLGDSPWSPNSGETPARRACETGTDAASCKARVPHAESSNPDQESCV